ncbi:P-loop containing nucleoside triphosphate hydrolase protein [Acephala macrosclerotiorum]|nr:P-loop containing nucleoside triphosphate hydrolase protein [Acephala macrosclerotiorum]
MPQQEYDDQLPEAPHSQVKPLTLILCPASITAYSLNRLKWGKITSKSLRFPSSVSANPPDNKVKVKVGNLQKPEFNPDVFDRVTWSDEQKSLLYASVKAHVEYGRENNRADSIARKQTGLVMLLHGPPSSGKSMAIDAIAQRFRIPLFTVDASRFTGTMDMETQLQEYLELALRWNAIVLFRKADQFVAEHAASQQGNLQYLFFRELESYTGIVALTTNRVGRMNEEFTSLFTLIFQFNPACDSDRMKIWENLLDHHGIENEERVKSYIREDKELKSLMLNGRQIRNLITTASSLAQAEGRKMGVMELEVAVRMTRNFMDYMSSVSMSYDEPRRARRSELRDDSFISSKIN